MRPETDSTIHRGQIRNVCVSSENDLSHFRCQANIWTEYGLLSVALLSTNFGEILIIIHKITFNTIYFKVPCEKCHPFLSGLNVLNHTISFSKPLPYRSMLAFNCVNNVHPMKYANDSAVPCFAAVTPLALVNRHRIRYIQLTLRDGLFWLEFRSIRKWFYQWRACKK